MSKDNDDVETGMLTLARDGPRGNLSTAAAASGMEAARGRSWLACGTWEPVASMTRERSKRRPREDLSTDARHRGGTVRSSVEGGESRRSEGAVSLEFLLTGQPVMGGT